MKVKYAKRVGTKARANGAVGSLKEMKAKLDAACARRDCAPTSQRQVSRGEFRGRQQQQEAKGGVR